MDGIRPIDRFQPDRRPLVTTPVPVPSSGGPQRATFPSAPHVLVDGFRPTHSARSRMTRIPPMLPPIPGAGGGLKDGMPAESRSPDSIPGSRGFDGIPPSAARVRPDRCRTGLRGFAREGLLGPIPVPGAGLVCDCQVRPKRRRPGPHLAGTSPAAPPAGRAADGRLGLGLGGPQTPGEAARAAASCWSTHVAMGEYGPNLRAWARLPSAASSASPTRPRRYRNFASSR